MNELDQICSAWKSSQSPVAMSGAGMSTASGLADFRSASGLWKSRPESLATLEALREMPDEFYFFYQWRIRQLWSVQPNAGHDVLAKLEELGRLQAVITQNVDGLHQRAGSRCVQELHGSLLTVSNLSRTQRYESRQLLPKGDFEEEYRRGTYRAGTEKRCPKSGEHLRPDVVLFGESLPEETLRKSFELSSRADFFVVLGSSLMVSPANHCPYLAHQNGAKLVIINQTETPLDDVAWKVIREPIADVMEEILQRF